MSETSHSGHGRYYHSFFTLKMCFLQDLKKNIKSSEIAF